MHKKRQNINKASFKKFSYILFIQYKTEAVNIYKYPEKQNPYYIILSGKDRKKKKQQKIENNFSLGGKEASEEQIKAKIYLYKVMEKMEK